MFYNPIDLNLQGNKIEVFCLLKWLYISELKNKLN